VWAESPDQFVVFSRACTDLSCPVRWDPGSQWFFCPCHGGIFDRRGEPRAGPPAVPLHRYQTRIRDGILEVDVFSVPPLI
jgi:Rieske Fe-S protein